MSIQNGASDLSSAGHGVPTPEDLAARAYRRAWWSLALYPVSFVAAFVIGEGIFSALTEDTGDAGSWRVLLAGLPALLVFVLPGIFAVVQGRRAIKLGRRDGMVPAIVGAVIGVLFVGQNIASYLLGLVIG